MGDVYLARDPRLNRQVASQSQVLPLAEFLSANLARIRPPDEVAVYDTYAITLAGYLVEQRSGMSYEQYLQRIAQLVICPVLQAELELVSALDETARGAGGYGSTGV